MKYAPRGSALLAFLIVTLSGCGGGDDGGTGPSQDANLAGTWNATITVTGGTQLAPGTQFTAVFALTQTGTSVSGTFLTEGGLSGALSGTVSDQSFSFAVSQGAPCLGTFNGSGSVTPSGTRLDGSYSGADCDGTLESDFVATKQ